ncbi:hypothetical protein K9M48_01440 [Candidatus Gracilibacteria bacterium]|nr:hypothetical protein [Candidatus Gracilibacteria bacterium]
MNISNKQLIEIIKKQEHNKYLNLFEIVFVISKKYSKLLSLQEFMNVIKTTNKDLFDLIILLKEIKKLNNKDLKWIVNQIKKDSQKNEKTIKVSVKSDFKNLIENNLKEKFNNSQIDINNQNELGITINGNGMIYKRNLENDLNKIFKK